jgi:hypothetical protein
MAIYNEDHMDPKSKIGWKVKVNRTEFKDGIKMQVT